MNVHTVWPCHCGEVRKRQPKEIKLSPRKRADMTHASVRSKVICELVCVCLCVACTAAQTPPPRQEPRSRQEEGPPAQSVREYAVFAEKTEGCWPIHCTLVLAGLF